MHIAQQNMNGRRTAPPVQGRSRLWWVIALLAAVIVALVLWVVSLTGETPEDTPGQQTEETEPVEKLTDSISLPGYGGLHLTAGKTEQNLALPNPAENFCQIRISLILKDGTVIWTSELTPPGEQAQIVLNEALEKGDYNATLKYDCFQMDENKTPLNGASCQLVLHAN